MESDDENITNENNNNNLSDKKKKEDKKENILNIKKKAEVIINENLKIGKSNELLPKIPLFNQNKKKILLNILLEKEIEKFEIRYECIDNAKNI